MSVFAVAALCFGQSPFSALASEMGVPYDPQNGFFELDLAGRQLRSSLPPYQTALKERRNGGEPKEAVFQKLRALEIRRAAVTAFKDPIALIEASRSKKVWNPRPEDARDSKAVSSVGIMAVGSFSVDFRAEVEFADGRPHAATACLRDAMRASELANSLGNVSGFLTAVVNNRLVFESVARHLPHLSLPDCIALEASIDPLSGARALLLAGIQAATREKVAALDRIKRMPKSEREESGLGFLSLLSEEQLARYILEAKDLHRSRMSELAKPLGMTLPDLAAYVDRQSAPERPDIQTIEQMPIPERILAQITADSLGSVPENALIQEVQLRLMRSALAVNRFRWTYDQLPLKLAAAGPVEMMSDPLSGQLFRYRILDGEFELSSIGSKVTGSIGLAYERPSPAGETRCK